MRKEATVTPVFSTTSENRFTQQAASNIMRLLLRSVAGSKPESVDRMITVQFPADTTDVLYSYKMTNKMQLCRIIFLFPCYLVALHVSSDIAHHQEHFSLSCKANARVKPAKTGHGPHSS